MSPGRQKILLILTCSGMEFTWRYAWVIFLTLVILKRPLPMPESLAVFALASVVAYLCNHRFHRAYQSLPLHFMGFALAWLFSIYRFDYQHMPFMQPSWIRQELWQIQHLEQALIRLLLLACLLLFWTGARALVKRSADYLTVCLQFDRGAGALFLMLLIRFIVEMKGGPRLADPTTFYLLFAFVIFSLIAIGLSRHQSDVQKTFRPGYHGIGVILSSTAILMAVGAIVIAFFLPYLAQLADSAHLALKKSAEPMGPVLVSIIRFLFSMGRYRQEMGGQIFSESGADRLYRDGGFGWAQGIGWFIVAVIGLITLWLCSYLIRLLVRWFRNRNRPDRALEPQMNLLARLLAMIGAIFQLACSGLLFLIKRIDSAAAIYTRMLRWGRRSGLPASASETPLEYGRRLMQRFPQLQIEIELIVKAFNREIYGQIPTPDRSLTRIKSAQRRMRHPRHWTARIRAWFAAPSLEI